MHIILELSVNELLTDLYTVNLWASFPPVLIHWWSFLNLAPKENCGTTENSRIRLIDRCARSTKNIYVGNNYTCNMIRQLSNHLTELVRVPIYLYLVEDIAMNQLDLFPHVQIFTTSLHQILNLVHPKASRIDSANIYYLPCFARAGLWWSLRHFQLLQSIKQAVYYSCASIFNEINAKNHSFHGR